MYEKKIKTWISCENKRVALGIPSSGLNARTLIHLSFICIRFVFVWFTYFVFFFLKFLKRFLILTNSNVHFSFKSNFLFNSYRYYFIIDQNVHFHSMLEPLKLSGFFQTRMLLFEVNRNARIIDVFNIPHVPESKSKRIELKFITSWVGEGKLFQFFVSFNKLDDISSFHVSNTFHRHVDQIG